jgi:hypothetical protein
MLVMGWGRAASVLDFRAVRRVERVATAGVAGRPSFLLI